jgi:hypothetical protein
MEIMNRSVQELSQLCNRVLRQQQPLIQSRIQTLLGEQEQLLSQPDNNNNEEELFLEEGEIRVTREEEVERIESGLAVAFSEVEQLSADIETLRPVYADNDNEVSPQQLRTLFRVFESIYFDMRDTIQEMEEQEDDEMPDLEEDAHGLPPMLGAMLGMMAGTGGRGAGIGMAAALLGVASGVASGVLGGLGEAGLSPEAMQRMMRELHLPADFFANVPVPMQDETLQAMPAIPYQEQQAQLARELNQECNICLQSFEPNDMVRLFPCCQVVQHSECLVGWFNRRDTCVVCKTKVCDTLKEKSEGNSNQEEEQEEDPPI